MYPEFLCIGAQKAGTTWLYHNLKMHAQIWLPPQKEIHYFDCIPYIPLIFYYLLNIGYTSKRAQKVITKLRSEFNDREKRNWYFRLLLSPPSDQWYASVFPGFEDKLVGEMTPKYAILDSSKIARIASLMPELKVIYLLRNPISRSWSAAAMEYDLFRKKEIDNVNLEELYAYFSRQTTLRHSSYLNNLKKWETYYPGSQICIGFFDQIASDPKGLLTSIYEFLDVDSTEINIPADIERKRNARTYSYMPLEIKRYLAERYLPEIRALHERFNNEFTAKWLQEATQASD